MSNMSKCCNRYVNKPDLKRCNNIFFGADESKTSVTHCIVIIVLSLLKKMKTNL